MTTWKSIASAPQHVAEQRKFSNATLAFGPWVLLRSAEGRIDRGRLRHAVEVYDIVIDQTQRREAAWWSAEDRPLGFEPAEWGEDDVE